MKKFLLLPVCILLLASNAFCDESTTPAPYEEDEFPQWAQDLRRFEIITLGSIPFTMIGTSLIYNGIKTATGEYSSFPNPFDKTSQAVSTEDQFTILAIAAGVSVTLSLTDLIITLVKRSVQKKQQAEQEEMQGRVVISAQEAAELLKTQSDAESE